MWRRFEHGLRVATHGHGSIWCTILVRMRPPFTFACLLGLACGGLAVPGSSPVAADAANPDRDTTAPAPVPPPPPATTRERVERETAAWVEEILEADRKRREAKNTD